MKNKLKVRLTELTNHNFKCWLDAGEHYLYGRSFVDHVNLTPEMIQTETDIETYLKQQDAEYTKTQVMGCLPEWNIAFKNNKDLAFFMIKWIDNPY